MLFVRSISQYESQQLYQLVRKSRNVIIVKRAEIIASSQGRTVPEIARLYHCSQEHVRQVIRKFNKEGLKALYPKRGGGRPKQISPEQEAYIVELALTPLRF
jgi:transposase